MFCSSWLVVLVSLLTCYVIQLKQQSSAYCRECFTGLYTNWLATLGNYDGSNVHVEIYFPRHLWQNISFWKAVSFKVLYPYCKFLSVFHTYMLFCVCHTLNCVCLGQTDVTYFRLTLSLPNLAEGNLGGKLSAGVEMGKFTATNQLRSSVIYAGCFNFRMI